MAPGVIRTVKSLPPFAQSTAAKLALLGIREGAWSYKQAQPLADAAKRIQIRDIPEVARPKDVAHYAEILKPYTSKRESLVMPPVIQTYDGWLLDGNTRTEGARKIGWHTYPAFVLDDTYEGAPQALVDLFLMVGTMFNTSNGKGLSPANTERLILQVYREGDKPDELARQLQVSRNIVASVLHARIASRRAEKLGISLEGYAHITKTHLSELGRKSHSFNDEPFRAILELTRDCGLNSTEQNAVAARVLSASTDKEKMAILTAERASQSTRVIGVNRRPLAPAQLRQHLGFLLKKDPEQLVERDPEAHAAYIDLIDESVRKLRKLLDLQEDLDRRRRVARENGKSDGRA